MDTKLDVSDIRLMLKNKHSKLCAEIYKLRSIRKRIQAIEKSIDYYKGMLKNG